MTVFQRLDFVEPWIVCAGPALGLELLVVYLELDGAALALWPLVVGRQAGARIASWAGGTHSSYNFGLFDRSRAAAVAALPIADLLHDIARRSRIDAFALTRQPHAWDGVANPFTQVPHQPSSSFGYAISLPADFASYQATRLDGDHRKKMRARERALTAAGDYRYAVARDPDEAVRVFRTFREQKAARLAAMGIDDPFVKDGIPEFYETMARAGAGRPDPIFEMHYIEAGGKVRAVRGGGVHAGRFTDFCTSFAHDELARASPGNVLLYRQVEECCRRGYHHLDLGFGEEAYKASWCDVTIPLIDSVVGITARGKVYAAAMRLRGSAKRTIRQNPAIWSVVKRVRRMRGSEHAPGDAAQT